MIILGFFALFLFLHSCIKFINNLFKQDGFVLHVCCTDKYLNSMYINCHNNYEDDAGFDLYLPDCIEIDHTTLIDMKVSCMMTYNNKPCAFYLYSRSSISKTPLLLHNSVGIIDKNYRGSLKIALMNTHHTPIKVKQGTRLVQVCAPSLADFKIKYVHSLPGTTRGTRGIGSTGT